MHKVFSYLSSGSPNCIPFIPVVSPYKTYMLHKQFKVSRPDYAGKNCHWTFVQATINLTIIEQILIITTCSFHHKCHQKYKIDLISFLNYTNVVCFIIYSRYMEFVRSTERDQQNNRTLCRQYYGSIHHRLYLDSQQCMF